MHALGYGKSVILKFVSHGLMATCYIIRGFNYEISAKKTLENVFFFARQKVPLRHFINNVVSNI